MGIFWQSRFPWITLMRKSLCAHCIGGKNCYPDNTLIDLLKPKVSFMLMRLNLLKEQDWSHFVALPVAAGRVEQGCSHPLLLNPVLPGTELQHRLSASLTLSIYWGELAHLGLTPCFSLYKSCSGERIGACWSQSAFWWFTEESAEPGLWGEAIPFISPSDRISRQTRCGRTANAHIWWRGKSLPAKCRLRTITLSLTWFINWTIWERRWWAHLGQESEEMKGC